MNDQSIQNLLRSADKPASLRDPREMAGRVESAYRRRRSRRALGGSCALILLIGGALWMTRPGLVDRPRDVRAEIAILDRQIAAQEAVVQRMISMEQRLHDRARLADLSQQPTDDQLTERAASVMVYQADRMIRETGSATPALKAYSEVISYFPQTFSAGTARQRVAELRKEG